MNISIWSITYQHYDEIINQSLNTCIILMGVGRIYSIQGEVVKRGGGRAKGYFQNSGGSWLKGGVKKFRGVWTLDEAMEQILFSTFYATLFIVSQKYFVGFLKSAPTLR